jgi:hypothetical protein
MPKQKIKTSVNDATLEAMLTMLRAGGIYTSKAMVACVLTCWELLEEKAVELITITEIVQIVQNFRSIYPEPVSYTEIQKK